MLKTLRLKFIIINMTIVTIMLGVIFGLLYYSTSSSLERESMQMMGSIALNPLQLAPPNAQKEDIHLPYFSVLIDSDGNASEIGGGFFDLSDDELLTLILQQTYEADSSNGVLEEYNLRFIRTDTPVGQCIVFADISSEQSTLQNLIRHFALIGSLAFLGFLAVSILLSHWALRPVEKAWLQQKQFVADASHELKTPLTVIMTDAELLHAPLCPETDRLPLTDSILSMTGQMRGLVENLLELARIDEGKKKKHLSAISFSDAASMSSMTFETVFFEKELSFDYAVEDNIMVKGDPSLLQQLSDIFLDNAAKYCQPHGKVFLSLRKISRRRCLLEVKNEGDPISAEDLKHLFKRFYRADQSRTMNHSYGLGLSIAQSIAQEHKGKVWAESMEGYNHFYAELPLLTQSTHS